MPYLARVATAARTAAEQITQQYTPPTPEPCSCEAEIAAIAGRYGAAIAAVRWLTMPREQIEAIIRGLMEQQRDEILGVRNRRKAKAAEGRHPKP